MISLLIAASILLILSSSGFTQTNTKREGSQSAKLYLRKGWSIQSSAQVKEKGDVLSQNEFQPQKWYPATVPSTIVGTLVEDKVYPEPLVGQNLRLMPGCSYPIGANFANLPMPEESPFRVTWWYRTQLRIPASYHGQHIWLHLDGINFRANIWLNGQQIANSDQIAGTFRTHELNITEFVKAGALNTLAIEVFPPQPDDLGWTWVDWNPTPPDKNMGIFRDVFLTSSGPVTLRYPQVVTLLDQPSLDKAHLTINAEVYNATDIEVTGTLSARIERLNFSQNVTLGPHETRSVTFSPDEFPQLNFSRPRLWWPVHMGTANLYQLAMEFETGGRISDRQ